MEEKSNIDFLIRNDFLDEIHHLLWCKRFVKNGVEDQGWSCRDHALLTAGLLHQNGVQSSIQTGKCMFVTGKSKNISSLGLEANLHSWVEIEHNGIIDLSPRFDRLFVAEGILVWPMRCMVSVQNVKSGIFNLLSVFSEKEYQSAIQNAIECFEERTIILYTKESLSFSEEMLLHPSAFLNSPLSNHLFQVLCLPHFIYAKMVNCLLEFVHHRQPTLQRFTRDDAWRYVASMVL